MYHIDPNHDVIHQKIAAYQETLNQVNQQRWAVKSEVDSKRNLRVETRVKGHKRNVDYRDGKGGSCNINEGPVMCFKQ